MNVIETNWSVVKGKKEDEIGLSRNSKSHCIIHVSSSKDVTFVTNAKFSTFLFFVYVKR